jgi:hypothetical protein
MLGDGIEEVNCGMKCVLGVMVALRSWYWSTAGTTFASACYSRGIDCSVIRVTKKTKHEHEHEQNA